MMKVLKWIKSILKRFEPLKIWVFFCRDILLGYRAYCQLVREFGMKTDIYSHYYPGTGDIYIASGLLKRRLLQNEGRHNYVMVVGSDAAKRVAELFELFAVKVVPASTVQKLTVFRYFCLPHQTNVTNLHYWTDRERIDISFYTIGFRGSTFFEQYLIYAFPDIQGKDFVSPKFSADCSNEGCLLSRCGLIPGKTAVLSPYANTSWKDFLPESFWTELAKRLKELGYTVCTNSAGQKEPPIFGTVPVQIPFSELKCFFESAGLFIGVRSGLCEVISSINCKKIVLYPSEYEWPEERTHKIATANEIFTLRVLPGAQDIIELDYKGIQNLETVDAILNIVRHERKRQSNEDFGDFI